MAVPSDTDQHVTAANIEARDEAANSILYDKQECGKVDREGRISYDVSMRVRSIECNPTHGERV